MLSMNGRISRDASRVDTTWLGKLELNVGDVFNWQISDGRGSVDWSHMQLNEEGLRKINKQENKREVFLFER